MLDEVDIDPRGLRSKGIEEVPLDEIDLAVILCREVLCPVMRFDGQRVSWPLPDPASAPSDDRREAFRAARDELLRRLPPLLSNLSGDQLGL